MAQRDHDGSEYPGAAPSDNERDASANGADGYQNDDGYAASPADQWFGDEFAFVPPPPPYAQMGDGAPAAPPGGYPPPVPQFGGQPDPAAPQPGSADEPPREGRGLAADPVPDQVEQHVPGDPPPASVPMEPQYGPPEQQYAPAPAEQYGPPPVEPQYGPPEPQYAPVEPQYGPGPAEQQFGPAPAEQYAPPPVEPQYGPGPAEQQYGPAPAEYGPAPAEQYAPPPVEPQYGPGPAEQQYAPAPAEQYGPPGPQYDQGGPYAGQGPVEPQYGPVETQYGGAPAPVDQGQWAQPERPAWSAPPDDQIEPTALLNPPAEQPPASPEPPVWPAAEQVNGAAPERPVWQTSDEPPEPEPLPPLDTVDDPWRGDAPPHAPGQGAFGDGPADQQQQAAAVPPPEYVVPERPAGPTAPPAADGPAAGHGPAPEHAPPSQHGQQIGPYSVPPNPPHAQPPYQGQQGPDRSAPPVQQGGQWQGGPQQGQAPPQGYQQQGPPTGAQQPYPQQPLSGPQPPYSQYQQQGGQGVVPGFPQSGPQPPFDPNDQRANWPENVDSLKPESLVRTRKPAPSKGWRKIVHSATFGVVHPGESAAELRRRELVSRARTHVAGGHHRVAVLSLKGGVGKTTTTVALGSTLSSLRGDRVLAVDANPDRGTLSDKVRLETAATIRDLLNEKDTIRRYADIRGFTSQAISRLEILASDRDPAVSEAFSEDDYREVSRLLEHYYSICLTDCGTGLLHSAMRGVLGLADQTVLVSTASVDGARSASATLDWLEAHEFGYLVRGAVVVLSMVRADGKSSIDLKRLEEHFASRCRAVVRVPWDTHLEEGAEVTLENLHANTRDAYLQLAATVGEAFAWPR